MYIFFRVLSVVANGDVQNPAARLLIPSRVIDQFERILEMITEKMGLRIVGGVRRYIKVNLVYISQNSYHELNWLLKDY